jgi:hypothetical protein
MELKHTFITKSHGLTELFTDKVNTLNKFMKSLEKQSLIDPLRYNTQDYLGDGFEFFIELLLHLHPVDNRLGVYNYQPVPSSKDKGIDGIGVNIKMEPCAVQIKYRSNTTYILTANVDHLSNFISESMNRQIIYDFENSKNYRHFIFTTAKGLHHYTESEMYEKHVKCFGYKELRSLVDNNLPFWNKVREIVKNLKKK